VIAPSGPSSESVEFYPPSFIFHLVLNKDQLAQYDQAEVNIMNTLPQLAIQKNFSIAHSLQHLKNELTHHLLPSGLITRSFKLWSIHSPPTSADQLILTPHEFSALDTQLINPASGDSADLNEALLTEPVNRIAIEQQHPSGNWLIIEPTTNPVPPSTPPQDADSTGPVFGGQDWLDRMERMNQANSLDPKFSLSTPVQPDLNLISSVLQCSPLNPLLHPNISSLFTPLSPDSALPRLLSNRVEYEAWSDCQTWVIHAVSVNNIISLSFLYCHTKLK
jgi:hypothetical protein